MGYDLCDVKPVVISIRIVLHEKSFRKLVLMRPEILIVFSFHADIEIIVPRDKTSVTHERQLGSPVRKISNAVLFTHRIYIF